MAACMCNTTCLEAHWLYYTFKLKPDASQIYLLTGKNYRISRSIKVSWFLDNFNKVVAPNPNDVIVSNTAEIRIFVCPPPCQINFGSSIYFLMFSGIILQRA